MNPYITVDTKRLVKTLDKYFRYSTSDETFNVLKDHLTKEKSLADKAVTKLNLNCQKGHVRAMLAMASLCKHMKTKEGIERAIEYYKMAIAAGNTWAEDKLKKLYSPKKEQTSRESGKTIDTIVADLNRLIMARLVRAKESMLTVDAVENSATKEARKAFVKMFESSCNTLTKQMVESIKNVYDTTQNSLKQLGCSSNDGSIADKKSVAQPLDNKKDSSEQASSPATDTPKSSEQFGLPADIVNARKEKSLSNIIDLLKKASDKGVAESSYRLGAIFKEKEPLEALTYFNKAVHQGHKKAATKFFQIVYEMDEITQSYLTMCEDTLLNTKNLHLAALPVNWRDFIVDHLAKSSIEELRIDKDSDAIIKHLPKTLRVLHLGDKKTLTLSDKAMINRQKFPKLERLLLKGVVWSI